MVRKLKVGIFGGSFDPPHIGHMYLAEIFRQKLNLDTVLFVPSGEPYHKRSPIAKPIERFAMVQAAASSNPAFRACGVDIVRKGPTFSIDTVKDLKAKYGKEAKFFFMVGADNVRKIRHWKNYKSLFRMCKFVAIPRPGIATRGEKLIDKRYKIEIVECRPLNISSRQIRSEIKSESTAVQYKLPPKVWSFIKRKGLYL